MKARTCLLKVLLLLLSLWAWPQPVHAYYDPGVQRWLNRDPLSEPGFESIGVRRTNKREALSNLYRFVANDAVNHLDALGLKLYKCVRQAKTMPNNLHAYIWDDKNMTSCGRTGGGWGGKTPQGEDAGDMGPYDPASTCVEIPNSDGKEDAVMSCCMRKDPKSHFFPWINDCHNWADNCLKGNGLNDPPLNRFNEEYWRKVGEGTPIYF